MEQRRLNWPAWLALGISIFALIVAFGSMAMSQRATWMMWNVPNWSNPQIPPAVPPAWHGRGERGPMAPGWHERGERGPMAPGWHERGERGFAPMPGWGMPGMKGGKGWFGGFFGGLFRLIDGLLKLAALALLVWLGIRIFRQRQNPPATTPPTTPPAPPLTPAGHDPRVE
ncbi:hypothetical protein [Chloroflexus sp.]|uniref:hypothetical protein n=1 Tax=Chloroflexus sp. TaxID=1904827 RepID=UPI003C73B09B